MNQFFIRAFNYDERQPFVEGTSLSLSKQTTSRLTAHSFMDVAQNFSIELSTEHFTNAQTTSTRMKTLITSVSGSSFRTAIASFVLAITLFVSLAATAQNISPADDSAIVSETSAGFQAAIHPIYNTLKMKVHVLNPAKDIVTVQIYDSGKQEVFKKRMGTHEVIHSRFDVASMPNGMYTITVRSGKKSFSRSFIIESQQERIAKAL